VKVQVHRLIFILRSRLLIFEVNVPVNVPRKVFDRRIEAIRAWPSSSIHNNQTKKPRRRALLGEKLNLIPGSSQQDTKENSGAYRPFTYTSVNWMVK
jgi:hypothetical protein